MNAIKMLLGVRGSPFSSRLVNEEDIVNGRGEKIVKVTAVSGLMQSTG